MIAEIKPSGTLSIQSETELEAYALRRWVEENTDLPGAIMIRHTFNVDCSKMEKHEVEDLLDLNRVVR